MEVTRRPRFDICDNDALVWPSPPLQQPVNPKTGHSSYADAEAHLLANAGKLQIAAR